jgi:hypothetical protein
MKLIRLWAIFTTLLLNLSAFASAENPAPVKVFGSLEFGFVGVLDHNIRFGKDNRLFSYTSEGAQDVLFPIWRGEAGLVIHGNHSLALVYQPIYISTQTVIREAVKFGDTQFNAGEPIDLDYYFPFYRLNYLYRFFASHCIDLWVGGGIQLRNATIRFSNAAQGKRFETTNVGPVPLISLAGSFQISPEFSMALDASGFWAPIRFLNGGSTDINGWIYDVGLKGKYQVVKHVAVYLSTRVIGGGALGTSKSPRQPYDGNSENTLVTLNATTGMEVNF